MKVWNGLATVALAGLTLVVVNASQAPQQTRRQPPPRRGRPLRRLPVAGREGEARSLPPAAAAAGRPGADRARQDVVFRHLQRLSRRRRTWRPAGRAEPSPIAAGPGRSARRGDRSSHPNGRPDKGMPPMPMNAADAKAVAIFLHSLLAAAGRQGSPPPVDTPPPDVLVGNAAAGQAYFAAKCATCHSTTGDLQGIAARVPDAKTLQNLWVSGGTAAGRGGRGGRGRGGSSARRSRSP